jgi:single-strand DNA-binding protein
MNKITATGRLAADAEVRYTASGDPIAGFRLASDVGFGDKKSTNWFSCTIFGKRGEALAPHLAKGQQVTVFGTLTLRPWTGKDGVEKISPDIRIDEIELQGGKKEGGETASRQAAKPAPNFSDMDDDIAF